MNKINITKQNVCDGCDKTTDSYNGAIYTITFKYKQIRLCADCFSNLQQTIKQTRQKEENEIMGAINGDKEREAKIKRIQEDCLNSTNMTKEEAYCFALRCWQLGYDKKPENMEHYERMEQCLTTMENMIEEVWHKKWENF